MEKGSQNKGIPIYWGCMFTHSVPFLMKSVNAVLDKLGIGHHDINDWSCCPDPVYVKAYGPKLHLALAGRNLSLIKPEKDQEKEMLVVCNGCYHTLAGTVKKLSDPKTLTEVNEYLEKDKITGKIKVTHLLELLTKKLPQIKDMAAGSLTGLRIAPYYGCHALRPPAVPGEDPENPKSIHELIWALGAEPVDYRHMLDCCGIPTQGFSPNESERLLEDKLADLADKADAIVTPCPSCFMQFDRVPRRLKQYALPVLHIGELVGLALGMTADELHLEMHATKADNLVEKIQLVQQKQTELKLVHDVIPASELESHCGACERECTMAIKTRDTNCNFNPLEIVDMLNEGKLDETLEDERIWRCLQCGACEVRCPQNRGLKKTFERLREEAIKKEIPKAIEHNLEMVKKTGFTQKPKDFVRKRIGLPPAPIANVKAIDKIIKKFEREKSES